MLRDLRDTTLAERRLLAKPVAPHVLEHENQPAGVANELVERGVVVRQDRIQLHVHLLLSDDVIDIML